MSLRPDGPTMRRILETFKGEPTIYSFLPGLQLPKGLILLHEHTDHFSLQAAEPMTLDDLNERMTSLLATLPTQTRQQFLDAADDPDDQDN